MRPLRIAVGRAIVGAVVDNLANQPLGSGVPDAERLEEHGIANALVVLTSSERVSAHSTYPSRERRFPSPCPSSQGGRHQRR